jgi:carbamoyltransferase
LEITLLKLLSLRLCEHDSNISFFDGKEIHYYKSEREHDIKHHAFDNLWQWKEVVYKKWNIKNLNKDVDKISIVIDPYRHNLPIDKFSFFPAINFEHLNIKNLVRVNHHYAHALSLELIYPNVKNHIVIDGFGDLNESVNVFKNKKIITTLHKEKNGSLGSLMCEVGQFLCIKANHPEDVAGKVMGIQSYGNLNKNFIKILSQCSLEDINKVFDLNKFVEFKKDLALADLNRLEWIRAVHEAVGDILLNFFKKFFQKNDHIGYSGGVAQNVIWNTKLKNNFKNLYLVPHGSDDGLSLGGLKFLLDSFNQKYIFNKFPFCQSDEASKEKPSDQTIKFAASAINNNKVVAWYQDNGEIGYRALGNRSLLFNAFNPKSKEIVNKIKNREYFRPFGASVLKEDAHKYFKNPIDNPFMLYVSDVINKQLYGITHVDGTCRYQTVDETNEGSFYKLLKYYKSISNESIILNTSLNLAGEPMLSKKEKLYKFIDNKDVNVVICGNEILKV